MYVNINTTKNRLDLMGKFFAIPVVFDTALQGVPPTPAVLKIITGCFTIVYNGVTELVQCDGIAKTNTTGELYVPALSLNKFYKKDAVISLTLQLPAFSKNASYNYTNVTLEESDKVPLVDGTNLKLYTFCHDQDNYLRLPYYQFISPDGNNSIKATFWTLKNSIVATNNLKSATYALVIGVETPSMFDVHQKGAVDLVEYSDAEDNPVIRVASSIEIPKERIDLIKFNKETPVSAATSYDDGVFFGIRVFNFVNGSKVEARTNMMFIKETPTLFKDFKAPRLADDKEANATNATVRAPKGTLF